MLEMDQANQRTGILGPDGVTLNGDPIAATTRSSTPLDPLVDARRDPATDVDERRRMHDDGLLSYDYDGGDHVVLGGTQGNDILLGGRGMDTALGRRRQRLHRRRRRGRPGASAATATTSSSTTARWPAAPTSCAATTATT